jgi:serine/threonine protein kinase/Tfp pilus assembly protein PilF
MFELVSYKDGDMIGEKYRVDVCKGAGTSTAVYLCTALPENLPVVLKTYQFKTDKERAMFIFEADVSLSMRKHPNVIQCYSVQMLNKQPFMLFERIPREHRRGTDLQEWLDRGPLLLETTLSFAIDICRGLIHAGTMVPGLVHRDIKPENVLIAPLPLDNDTTPIAKISDFGVAIAGTTPRPSGTVGEERFILQSQRGLEGPLGNQAYKAPEQWRNEPLDVRADIYAVGCLLYTMLSGNPPFDVPGPIPRNPDLAPEWHLTWRKHHESTPPPALSIDIPIGVQEIVTRCLEKDKTGRFSSFDDLLHALLDVYRLVTGQVARHLPQVDALSAGQLSDLGSGYRTIGRYEKALELHTAALVVEPDHPILLYNRGKAYDGWKRWKDARQDYGAALRLISEEPRYSEYAQLLPVITTNYLNTLISQAVHYLNTLNSQTVHSEESGPSDPELMTESQKIIEIFDKLIEANPTIPGYYFNRALAHQIFGEPSEALLDYEQTIEMRPDLMGAYSNAARLLISMERFSDAKNICERGITVQRNYAPCWFFMGNAAREMGYTDEAFHNYEKAIEYDPDYRDAYYNAARINYNWEAYADACLQLDELLKRYPKDAPARWLLCQSQYKSRQYSKALDNLNMILVQDPASANEIMETLPGYGDPQVSAHIEEIRRQLDDPESAG